VDSEVTVYETKTVPIKSLTGTETILIAEDEDGVRRFTRKVLQQQGYKVLEAQDGMEAISICQEYSDPIHLLLTDTIMQK